MNTRIFFLLFILLSSTFVFGQTKKFKIYNHKFIIKNKKANNDWKTKDDIRNVYITKNGQEKLILTYFAYKNEGGDCNNLFWDKEWLKVKGNKITIITHHFQERLDPITEWEKKIFIVRKNGEVALVEQLYKKYGSNEWKENEE